MDASVDGPTDRAPLPLTGSQGSASSNLSATRRRQIGSDSARSMLLTVLGEFVHPRGEPVWTNTLVEALGALGVEEKSARQALSRTAGEGILESSRHGRRVLWALTAHGNTLLEQGTERIYGFMRGGRPWDGQWLILSVPIPESQRKLRHRLRTRLTWLGMGSPTSGLWVSPNTSNSDEVHAVIRSLGLEDRAFSWAGTAGGIGSESRILVDAWDLDQVEDLYLQFIDEFEARPAKGSLESFVAQVELVQAWRRFPFLDPDLPPELLDHDWPGPRAANAFHERHARWNREARSAWETFDKAGGAKP